MNEQETMKKPLPVVIDIDKEFWEGAQNNKLLLQKCLDCNRFQFFPRPVCVSCFGTNLNWEETKGVGTVYTFTLVRWSPIPLFMKQIQDTGKPYVLATIDLDEGARIISRIIGCEPEEVKEGMRVKVTFVELDGSGFKVPYFQPLK